MRQSFDKYLEHSETDDRESIQDKDQGDRESKTKQAKDYLADGLFAYQMIVEICKKELDELYEDGIKYFDMFINFIFDVYEEMDRKEIDLYTMTDEKQSRYVELRSFIKAEIFDDFLIVFLTRVGTQGLINVLVY